MLKLTILAIPVLMLLNHYTYGQSTNTTMQKLIDQQLIARKDVRAMEKLLNQLDERSDAAYLYALLQLEFKKRFGQYPGSSLFSSLVTFGEDSISIGNDQRAKINSELSGYLFKLKASTLINDKQFRTFQEKVENNEFVDVLQLLMSISEQVGFDEYMNADDLKTFADKLNETSIVTTRYDELLESIAREGSTIRIMRGNSVLMVIGSIRNFSNS